MIINPKTKNILENYTIVNIKKNFDDILNKNNEYEKKYGLSFDNFPLLEGVIKIEIPKESCLLLKKIECDLSYYYFKINKYDVYLEKYEEINKDFFPKTSCNVNLETLKFSNNTFNPLKLNALQTNVLYYDSKNVNYKQQTFLRFMQYLLYLSYTKLDRNIMIKSDKGDKKNNTNNNHINKNKKLIKVWDKDRIIYSINGEKVDLKSFSNKDRYKGTWTVSGHFRHYKNGMKTWINSYKKGNGNEINNKYYLK